ncbi:hypothetical protein [Mangrovimonas spongiae]|uniref:Uncharacterized protein n=1 Tax=Mangrovimonas spongiae TaxID=2494697 RepID=A0A3R9PME9_9FLAO|nr:hypothetical protein [Mangrovimonas spongiae]RSK41642.1 hypothetical protein EJA19_01845 [Mangrovimonas spongiae]
MPKTRIAIFFSIIFMMFLVAPTVISVIEDTYDLTIFYSVNEEENKEQNEVQKNLEVKYLENLGFSSVFWDNDENNSFSYYLKNYSPLVLECVSPPPEQNIL